MKSCWRPSLSKEAAGCALDVLPHASLKIFFILAWLLSACVVRAATDHAVVWIKHTGDNSTWPTGFANVPQPAQAGDITRVDGSDESNGDTAFDGAMRAKGNPHTWVYVGPGLFKTRGAVGAIYAQTYKPGFRLQDHARLIGAGKGGYQQNGTTIKLVACNEIGGGLVIGANQFEYWDEATEEFRYSKASDIWVTDLQVDCNGPELSKKPGTNPPVFDPTHSWEIQGVQLWATGRCHIERVHVIHAIGADITVPIVENFILCINSVPGASTGNVILDCTVTDFYNPTGWGGCSAISLNRFGVGMGTIEGIISGCEVVLNGDRGWGYGGEFAYNAASGWGLIITNCVSRGAQRAFNNDSLPNFSVSFVNNRFEMPAGLCYAIYLLMPNRWSRFHNNTITLNGAWSCGFVIDNVGGEGNNLILDHNTIVIGSGPWQAYPFNLNDHYLPELIPINVHLEKNKVVCPGGSSRVLTLVPPTVGYMAGNSVNDDLDLWPVPQPNPGWTYTPARADLLNDGTIDLVLQDPAETIYCYSLSGAEVRSPTITEPSRPLQAGWRVVGAGDLNVDGQTDLILNHPELGLGYWLLRGTVCTEAGPITSAGQPVVLGGSWQVVSVADFNRDGRPDLLLQDEDTYLGIWHLKGSEIEDQVLLSRSYAGGLGSPGTGAILSGSTGKWRAVGTGDFDGNGNPDILFQYDLEANGKVDGQLAVWYMDDAAVLGTAMLDPVRPVDPNWRVVATGDFRHTSSVDIVFQKKEPRQSWGGALTVWSMKPQNRIQRLSETLMSSVLPIHAGSRNVVGPR